MNCWMAKGVLPRRSPPTACSKELDKPEIEVHEVVFQCMHVCMFVCMYVCMYVYVSVLTFIGDRVYNRFTQQLPSIHVDCSSACVRA